MAQLNFLRPMLVPPVLDISGSGSGNLKLEPREVELADADAQNPQPSLSSHGCAAVPFSASLPGASVDLAYRRGSPICA